MKTQIKFQTSNPLGSFTLRVLTIDYTHAISTKISLIGPFTFFQITHWFIFVGGEQFVLAVLFSFTTVSTAESCSIHSMTVSLLLLFLLFCCSSHCVCARLDEARNYQVLRMLCLCVVSELRLRLMRNTYLSHPVNLS